MKTQYFLSCCCFCALCAVTLQSPAVHQGMVGKNLTVGCSFTLAAENKKYFCRGTCSGEDILIETTLDNNQNGRYKIDDKRDGVFYVTIMDLKKTDSGQYKCGAARLIIDSHQMVNIQVHDAPTSAQPSVVPPEPKTPASFTPKPSTPCSDSSTEALTTSNHTFFTPAAISPPADTRGQSYALHAGIGILVLGFLVIALTLLLCKKRIKRPPENFSSNIVNAESSPTEAVYEEVALEGALNNNDEHAFNQATAFTGQKDIISHVDANRSSPDNVMDFVCAMHELDEDPGEPIVTNNPVYSSSS